MALVLCTGSDPVLLETRKLIIEHAGHIVTGATHQQDVISACKKGIEVAVIGQSVSRNNKKLISSLVREHCPGAKILELYRTNEGRTLADVDAWLEVPADIPQQLADEVDRLAGAHGVPPHANAKNSESGQNQDAKNGNGVS